MAPVIGVSSSHTDGDGPVIFLFIVIPFYVVQ